MEDFVSIKNFIKQFQILNSYSKDKYKETLELQKYKKIIGKVIEDIYRNYKNKINKRKGNTMLNYIMKNIIDKEMEKKYFESENTIFEMNNLKNLVDTDVNITDDLTIRNVYEKRFDKILDNDNSNFDNKTIIKKKNEDIKDFFIMRKDDEIPIDLTKNPAQNREELIISPDEYLKNLQKTIKYQDIIIDSRDRNTDKYPDTNNFTVDLEEDLYSIISIELISAEIPNVEYIINNDNNLLHFEETMGTTLTATIPIGNYTLSELATELQTQLIAIGSSTYTVSESDYQRITETFTSNSSRITSNAADPYLIFDADVDTSWTSSTLPGYFIYDLQTEQVINKYRFICTDSTGRPVSWTLDVSNDKTTWTTIDTRSSESINQFVYATYTIAANAFVGRYVRFNITDSSNLTNVHISELEYFKSVTNKITIISDLTGGGGIFNLLFQGRDINIGHLGNGTKTLVKENSIGELIGFSPTNFTGFSNYTSENQIILDRERKVFLYLHNLDNIHTLNDYESNRFVQLTLESEKGEYSYFKNTNSWTDSYKNEFIYFTDKPISLKKLKIEFKKYNGNYYNFYGININLHLRIKYFNFQNDIMS